MGNSVIPRIEGHQINVEDLERILGGNISYEKVVENFDISKVEHYNMAGDTVDRHAAGENADTVALVCESKTGKIQSYTYRELSQLSDQFAAFLRSSGVRKGDVIACFAGQGLESALAHLGSYKLGAIVAPLSQLYGPEAVKHVLKDCDAKVVVTERSLWERIKGYSHELPIQIVILSGGAKGDEIDFDNTLTMSMKSNFSRELTNADDPALLLYTSGSTGMPKGILHRQRLLRGYLSSVSLFYEMDMSTKGQVLWTVSDWSWVAGIFNVMLTGWYFGQTVVAGSQQFTPAWAFSFMERHRVTHCFLTPTALKKLAGTLEPHGTWPGLCLRAIGTGGEPLPAAVLQWARNHLAIPINEFYGLTEVNHLIGNCDRLWPIKPGSMGRAYPGHTIAVLDESGQSVPPGTVGEIAARDDDPTLFIEYWKNPERTAAIHSGSWILTGDFGYQDDDGYFWYKGREDDLIKSSGYRIGPAEIEDVLIGHPYVAEAVIIGIPDEERGQLIKAFVSLVEDAIPSATLVAQLQEHVKTQLAFFKYPRIIEFVDTFPLTSTGKINRKELRKRELHQN